MKSNLILAALAALALSACASTSVATHSCFVEFSENPHVFINVNQITGFVLRKDPASKTGGGEVDLIVITEPVPFESKDVDKTYQKMQDEIKAACSK